MYNEFLRIITIASDTMLVFYVLKIVKWIQYCCICSITVLFRESGMGAAATLTLDHGLQLCNNDYGNVLCLYNIHTQIRYMQYARIVTVLWWPYLLYPQLITFRVVTDKIE